MRTGNYPLKLFLDSWSNTEMIKYIPLNRVRGFDWEFLALWETTKRRTRTHQVTYLFILVALSRCLFQRGSCSLTNDAMLWLYLFMCDTKKPLFSSSFLVLIQKKKRSWSKVVKVVLDSETGWVVIFLVPCGNIFHRPGSSAKEKCHCLCS